MTVLPLALLVLLGAHWGLSFSLAKIAGDGGVGALAYTFWQAAASGPLLAAAARLRGSGVGDIRAHWRFLLTMGLTGYTIPNTNMVLCVAHLPVGVLALVVPFAPLVTYALAWALGMERLTLRRVAGLALGLGGVALIVLPEASLPARDQVPWVFAALLTPAFYAVSNVYAARRRPPGLDSLALAGGMQLTNAALLLPVMLAAGQWYAFPLPDYTRADLAILVQVWIACFGPVVFLEIVRRAGPVFFSQVGYLVSIAGVLWGMLLFGERHSPWLWAAMGCVFAGVVLVSGRPRLSDARG